MATTEHGGMVGREEYPLPETKDGGEVKRFDVALERLRSEVEILDGRLGAALVPEVPSEVTLNTARQGRSPLGDQVDRLEDLTTKLVGIRTRLTL